MGLVWNHLKFHMHASWGQIIDERSKTQELPNMDTGAPTQICLKAPHVISIHWYKISTALTSICLQVLNGDKAGICQLSSVGLSNITSLAQTWTTYMLL